MLLPFIAFLFFATCESSATVSQNEQSVDSNINGKNQNVRSFNNNNNNINDDAVMDLGGSVWSVVGIAGPGQNNVSIQNVTVPTDSYTALQLAGVIKDPLNRFGDWDTAWVGETSFAFEREFSLTDEQVSSSTVLLVLDGVMTNASIFINEEQVLETDNAWMRYSVPISVQAGVNKLSIRIQSVYTQCEFTDPVHSNVSCPGRVYVRQACSSWGWDWVKRYSSVGVWRPVFLVFVKNSDSVSSSSERSSSEHNEADGDGKKSNGNGGVLISGLNAIVREESQEDKGVFSVDLFIQMKSFSMVNNITGNITLQPSWLATPIEQEITVNPGDSSAHFTLRARDVKLWWPVGYGDQILYNITAIFTPTISSLSSSSLSTTVGFRSVYLQTDRQGPTERQKRENEGAGGSGNTSMSLLINGVPIFIRGSSFVPMDSFSGRITDNKIKRLFQSVVAANMNTLRIWGGGDFLTPNFYHYADSYGVLLLHDFMLSWYPNVPYPAYANFTQRISTEVSEIVGALAHHPSIVLWFGGNEDMCTRYDKAYKPDGCTAGSMAGADTTHCDQIFADCKTLYIDTVLTTIAKVTSVPLWPVSPSAGWAQGVNTATGLPDGSPLVELETAVATASRPNQGALDVHGPYATDCLPGGLREGEIDVLFHSEFGQLSLPQYEELATVLLPEDFLLSSPALNERSTNGAINLQDRIINNLGKNLVDFTNNSESSFRRVIYLSQLVQSECLRYTVESGRLAPSYTPAPSRPSGYLFWQLNDVMQGSSWGSLSYSSRFKLNHYSAKNWFRPVHIACNFLDSTTSSVSCSVSNENAFVWGGFISFALDSLTSNSTPAWQRNISVTGLLPGFAQQFFVANLTELNCGSKLCWLYGSEGVTIKQIYFALPLLPLTQLTQILPKAAVSASVIQCNTTQCDISLQNDPSAAALNVHVTTECMGQFSESNLYLRPGERRDLSFQSWTEFGDLSAVLFTSSLRLHWLNQA